MNRLSGSLPPLIGNLINLQQLILFNNQLEGPLPDVSKLRAISECQISINAYLCHLEVPLTYVCNSASTPKCMSDCLVLHGLVCKRVRRIWSHAAPTFECFAIQLQLQLATWISLFSCLNRDNARDFSKSGFSGTLPPEIRSLTNLKQLFLSHNSIDGPLPSSLCNLRRIRTLALHEIKLNGSIPSCFVDFNEAKMILLHKNQFSGAFLSFFGALPRIQTLTLGGNSFHGAITDQMGNLRRYDKVKILRLNGTLMYVGFRLAIYGKY